MYLIASSESSTHAIRTIEQHIYNRHINISNIIEEFTDFIHGNCEEEEATQKKAGMGPEGCPMEEDKVSLKVINFMEDGRARFQDVSQ